MKKNIFTLMFGLLLAVGWTNVASAQALPIGNSLDRMGLTNLQVQKAPETALKSDFRGEFQSRPAGVAIPKMEVPLRANNKPDVVKPKSYYEGLTYSWVNPETGDFGNDVPSTEIADDPYQIYELLRFVYKDKRFPGPYYSAYDSNGNRERQVYYGAVAGGWDISDGDVTPEPVGDITLTVASGDVNLQTITITCDGNAVTWDATTATTTTVTYNGNQRNAYTLPTGWQLTSGDYVLKYQPSGSAVAWGYIPGGGTITISTNGATHVTVDIVASTDDTTQGLSVNGNSVALTGSDAPYNWSFGTPASGTYTKTVPVMDNIILTGTQYAYVKKIEVSHNGHVITSFDTSTGGTTLPAGWTFDVAPGIANDGSLVFNSEGANLIIMKELLEGYGEVEVNVTAYNYPVSLGYSANTYPAYVSVNGNQSSNITSGTGQVKNWPVSGQAVEIPVNNPNVYTPNEEGYTALIVVLNNNTTPAPQTFPENDNVNSESYFNTKEEIINYFKNNVAYVQLLTDGLRIGSGLDEGTVFNCSGTYNKFFFLGKGQARQKDDYVLLHQMQFGYLLGERAPFKEMFEEFSPTGGEAGSQITDFYIEMMDGAVYDVVHDCASVIDNGHQFSMSGNNGTQDYAMSGMNFFIPDYRLMYWTDEYSYRRYSVDENNDTTWYNYGPYTVDGRTMNPYLDVTGNAIDRVANYTANFAQYYPQHAPKVGLYTLALDAEAYPVDGYDIETNAKYTVTLDWTSSLNEMSGSTVPQTYEIYEVTYVDGVETLVYIATVTNDTHYTFPEPFPQGDHSVTHTYIIKGTPTTSTHPEFVAWSNEDAVVIPGLEDFLALGIDHYESDFDVPNVKNWYRNFLTVSNDNEAIGLTLGRIQDGEDTYALYRYDYEEQPDPSLAVKERVATIVFGANSNNTVDYLIEYENQEIEPYTIDKPNRNPPVHIENAYELSTMGIPTEGTLTVAAEGDIVIQPNGYDVNFLSITVQAGNYNRTWNSSQTSLPNGWSVTGGSMWVLENGAYYLEGGGFILIPASILGNYSTGTVTINAYGDPGKVAKITVNGTTHTLYNGENNARDYVFTVGNGAKLNAPNRAESINLPIEVTDYLTYENFAATSTTYTDFTGKTLNSGAVLAGNSARNTNGYIQLRATNPSGIVTTTSGGNRIKSIRINVGSGNAEIEVYVKSTAYSSGADLYSNSTTTRGTRLGRYTSSTTITVDGNYQYFGIRSRTNAVYISSIEVVWEKVETPAYDNLIDDWDYNVDGVTMPTGWILTPGDASGSSGQGNGDAHNGIWMNEPGNITIPASVCDGYENIKVVAMYGIDPLYTGSSTMYLTANDVQGSNATIPFVTNEWSNVDASNGIVIVPNNGWLTLKSIRVYGDPVSIPPTPSGEGLVRMGNMMLVDQFADEIPDDNSHSRRWGYVLMLDDENSENESGTVQVPVQHTGATVQGYYTVEEMLADTDPDNFLTEDVLSAELNMNLSPTSAPYYYTINSKKNAAPVDAWHNYVSVLQRREIGDYQEMQSPSPYNGNISQPGNYEFFDFRKVVAESKDDYLTYVPIIWTKGIDRRYYVEDSLHNSYGAPIWEVHPGDVMINNSVVQRQARQDATGNWIWNNSVNYTLDGTDYSLYFAEVTATGVLPQNTGIEYEPYMFRVWLVDSTESLRDYTWTYNDENEPLHIDDAGAIPGAWKLLDTYMCDGADDLVYSKSITTDYANNLQFAAPIENFHPIIMVRFYFKVKGAAAPTPSGMRGQGEDNVGHVAIKGTNPHDPSTAVAELYINGEVVSKTYYNVQGMESDKPFDGINIVVTRYSNGATTTTKVRH